MTGGIEAVQARIAAIESRIAAIGGAGRTSAPTTVTVGASAASPSTEPYSVVASRLAPAADSEKVDRLNAYMKSRNFNQGLAAEAATFAAAAEENGMDWRLGVAVAVAESSGGRQCFRPYNPFGITGKSFANWEEAVRGFYKLVAGYGFGDDPGKILAKYNPGGGQTYVNNVIREMESV